jgi:hypothetical protein
MTKTMNEQMEEEKFIKNIIKGRKPFNNSAQDCLRKFKKRYPNFGK